MSDVAAAPGQGGFALIARHFAPLSREAPLAFGLTDDGAVIRPEPGRDLVITADAMVADVHFLADDPADLIARKLLRVNLSDLAAMAARPLGYLLTAAWPRGTPEDWIALFADGLRQDQAIFGLPLLGGDTVSTPGPLTLSLTAIGWTATGSSLRRNGARPGDLVCVSGTVGDGALGLRALRGELAGIERPDSMYLADRYHLPQPRLELGWRLAGIASAALDVSDGLLADLGHICECSGVAAEVDAEQLPRSPAAAAALERNPGLFELLLSGGDDYELLFTVPPGEAGRLPEIAAAAGVAVQPIGRIVEGEGVRAYDSERRAIPVARPGFRHF